jgi:hypothetical protein
LFDHFYLDGRFLAPRGGLGLGFDRFFLGPGRYDIASEETNDVGEHAGRSGDVDYCSRVAWVRVKVRSKSTAEPVTPWASRLARDERELLFYASWFLSWTAREVAKANWNMR